MATIQSLAAEMNAKPADVAAFIECLRVWVAKGYSVDEAIGKHMAQMIRLVNNAHRLPMSVAVDAFYPD